MLDDDDLADYVAESVDVAEGGALTTAAASAWSRWPGAAWRPTTALVVVATVLPS